MKVPEIRSKSKDIRERYEYPDPLSLCRLNTRVGTSTEMVSDS
jgi:hypothetical protein